MRKTLKGAVSLLIFIMALSVISCSKTVDTELFVHKSPDFTLTVPKWADQISKDPNSLLKRKPESASSPVIEVTVSDLPSGWTYKDSAPAFIKGLESQLKGSNIKILYEREIKLKDGTSAYEYEVKWKIGMWPLRSFAVVALKDKKKIFVCITDILWIGDKLKQYPLSLKLING